MPTTQRSTRRKSMSRPTSQRARRSSTRRRRQQPYGAFQGRHFLAVTGSLIPHSILGERLTFTSCRSCAVSRSAITKLFSHAHLDLVGANHSSLHVGSSNVARIPKFLTEATTFRMQFADKTTLGQSAILGLLCVRCLPRRARLHLTLVYQPRRSHRPVAIQLAGYHLLPLFPRLRMAPESRFAVLPCREMDEVRHHVTQSIFLF